MRIIALVPVLLMAGCTGANPDANTTRVAGSASRGIRPPGVTATQVLFEPGTTSTSMDGRMEANQDAEFVIGWEAGEMLVASVVGSQHEVVASVHRADTGAEIPDSTPDHSFWINRLPQSIGYLVVLHGTSEPTDYNLLSAFLANLSSVRFHRRSTFRASMCRQMESCRICFRQAEWSMCFMASAWACCARDRGVHQNTSAPKSIAIVRKEDAPPRLLRLTA